MAAARLIDKISVQVSLSNARMKMQGRGRKGSGGSGAGGEGRGRGQERGFGVRTGGECVCPSCGKRTPHQRGVPCVEVSCPECGSAMTRGQ
jgi:hypothetical protein